MIIIIIIVIIIIIIIIKKIYKAPLQRLSGAVEYNVNRLHIKQQ